MVGNDVQARRMKPNIGYGGSVMLGMKEVERRTKMTFRVSFDLCNILIKQFDHTLKWI